MGAFTIRPVDLEDAEPIAAIYAPIVAKDHISFEVDPPPTEEMARRVTQTSRDFPLAGRSGK